MHHVLTVIGEGPETVYGDPNTYVSSTMKETKEDIDVKKQGFWSIKLGLDRNQTVIRRPKVTDVVYNIVAPYYIIKG